MVTLRVALPGDVRAAQGLDEMVIKPAYGSCAKATEDCLEPRCCASSGYSCFKTSSGKGKCMKECTPGGLNGTCEGVAPHMREVAASPATQPTLGARKSATNWNCCRCSTSTLGTSSLAQSGRCTRMWRLRLVEAT